MNRQEFEHIIRACGAATSCKELLIVGSQAILGSVPDSPRELRVSLELDVSPIPFSEEAVAIIDGNIGSQLNSISHSISTRMVLDRILLLFPMIIERG